jgi:hypothetical protein
VNETPPTLYATGSEVCIAYLVTGDGPFDLLFVPDWRHQVGEQWDNPAGPPGGNAGFS